MIIIIIIIIIIIMIINNYEPNGALRMYACRYVCMYSQHTTQRGWWWPFWCVNAHARTHPTEPMMRSSETQLKRTGAQAGITALGGNPSGLVDKSELVAMFRQLKDAPKTVCVSVCLSVCLSVVSDNRVPRRRRVVVVVSTVGSTSVFLWLCGEFRKCVVVVFRFGDRVSVLKEEWRFEICRVKIKRQSSSSSRISWLIYISMIWYRSDYKISLLVRLRTRESLSRNDDEKTYLLYPTMVPFT